MQANTSTDGVVVRFYPARLSDTALFTLATHASDTLYASAPAFAEWLAEFAENERVRRICGDYGDVRESDLPRIPVHQWSDKQIGDGLAAATWLSYALLDETAGKFCDKLVAVLTAAAQHRLSIRGTK